MTKTKPAVFISSSNLDAATTDWARQFARALEDQGAGVWFGASGVTVGDSLADTMELALRGSDIIVEIVDANNEGTPSLFFEIGAAIALGKRLIAVIPRGLDPERLPHPLRTRHHLIQGSPQSAATALLHDAA